MLFTMTFLEGLVDGRHTLAFRRWREPRVKAGSRMRTAVGIVEVDSVERVSARAIGDEDAARAGHASRTALLEALDERGADAGDIYRVALRLAGADPRIALREKPPSADELESLRARLARLDAAATRAGHDAWTVATLTLIATQPEGTRAAALAAHFSMETQPFKLRVRKLKELGLTESLETGYRVSPRGRALLAHLGASPSRRPTI